MPDLKLRDKPVNLGFELDVLLDHCIHSVLVQAEEIGRGVGVLRIKYPRQKQVVTHGVDRTTGHCNEIKSTRRGGRAFGDRIRADPDASTQPPLGGSPILKLT